MTYTFKIARRMASNHRRLAPLALGLALLTACGATAPTAPTPAPPAPQAGWLTIQLDTPNADDGAIQLAVYGPAAEEAEAVAAYNGMARVVGTTTYLVVTGSLGDGAVARIRVPDVSKATQYSATLQAVAVRGTYALRSTAGYQLAIVR